MKRLIALVSLVVMLSSCSVTIGTLAADRDHFSLSGFDVNWSQGSDDAVSNPAVDNSRQPAELELKDDVGESTSDELIAATPVETP